MESNQRLLVKAVTWQILGFLCMTLIGYVLFGSLITGGTMAFAGAIVGLFGYFAHEKIWGLVSWGREGSKPIQKGKNVP